MENLRSFEELNESSNTNIETTITLLTTVDDYEHEGDTERDVKKWRTLGAKTKVIPPEIPEDNPAPMIEVTMRVSSTIAKDMIERAKKSLGRAEKTGDYGAAIYSWDVEQILEEYDKKNKTDLVGEFSKELKELEEMH